MDFWGVTVEPNKQVLVEPKFHTVIHISEAAIGKAKSKETETVHLNVEVGGQKFVMGTVTPQKSKSFDLLFSEKFTLSHNSPNPVHFIGYKMPDLDGTSPSKPNERPVDDDEAGVSTTSLSKDTANTTTMAKKESKKRRTR